MSASESRWPELVLAAFGALALAVGFQGTGGDRAGAYEPGPRAESGLRVVTWNVGGYSGVEAHSLGDEALGAVAAVLRDIDPDIAFLQEVASREQGERLRSELGDGWSLFGPRRRSGRRVIALTQRGEAESLGRRLRGGERRMQGLVYARAGRRPVAALGLHASAYSAGDRNALVGEAAELLEASGEELRLLAGDFNLDLGLDKRRDLFSDDEHRDVETYSWLTLTYLDLAQGTGATAEPDRRLDYVFGAGPDLDVAGAGPVRGLRVGDMDHDPVVVDLR